MNLGNLLGGTDERTALIDLSDAGSTFNYRDLGALIRSAEVGVVEGERVGLLGANSAAFVIVFSAIMRAGGVAVPINTKFPMETIRHVVNDAGLKTLWVDADLEDRVPSGVTVSRIRLTDPNGY